MLAINTQLNQAIEIRGKDLYGELTVIGINEDNNEVRLRISKDTFKTEVNEFTMTIGSHCMLLPDVKLTFLRIDNKTIEYAILGFDAPREISIRGQWYKDAGVIVSERLAKMSDESLLYYAEINSKTLLERELKRRLRAVLS